ASSRCFPDYPHFSPTRTANWCESPKDLPVMPPPAWHSALRAPCCNSSAWTPSSWDLAISIRHTNPTNTCHWSASSPAWRCCAISFATTAFPENGLYFAHGKSCPIHRLVPSLLQLHQRPQQKGVRGTAAGRGDRARELQQHRARHHAVAQPGRET